MQRHRNPYYKQSQKSDPERKAKPRSGSLVKWSLLVVALATAGYFGATPQVLTSTGLAGILPVPKKLLTIEVLHNDQKNSLEANSQLVMNPRDTLQLLEVRTDGWMQRGTRVVASDFPIAAIERKPSVVGKLWPQETFDSPRQGELQVL
jgi:hypothetical protein